MAPGLANSIMRQSEVGETRYAFSLFIQKEVWS
jgi:hypothetical protein